MNEAKRIRRIAILSAALLLSVWAPALAGGVAIVSHTLADNGDHDGFADTQETAQVFLTVRNTSAGALSGVTASVYGLNPDVACTSKTTLAIGDLAAGQTVTTTDFFEFTVSAAADRTALGLSPYEPLSAEFTIVFEDASGPVDGFPPDLSFDLDLDISGGSGATSYLEDFESMTLGTFEVKNLDAGHHGLVASDGYRCQYNDPDNPNSNVPGRAECYLAPNPAHADAVWWHLSGPNFSPAGGRGFGGFHSLFYGQDLGPPENWTTPMAVLEGAGMIDPVHIARDAVEPTLIWKHQVSLADGRAFSLPYKQTYDRGAVAVQVAADDGAGVGPWFKVDPYQNPYDQQNAPIIINCGFDPVDDGNTEDDFFAPGDPNRRFGPSSTCYPEHIYADIGDTDEPFDAANLGRADGPGLQGLWGIGTWIESKVDLSRFRGRSIRVRFVASSLEANPSPQDTWDSLFGGINPIPGDDGWWIDDVEVSALVATAATVAKDDKDNSGLPGVGGADPDTDGLVDSCDNCPLAANTGQEDGDLDSFGDVCDVCPYSTENEDPDMDSACGLADNCPGISNPTQTDADGDGWGLACDCNDADPGANPGETEANNGLDEDCDGVADELEGVTASKSGTIAIFVWPAQPLAQRYQMVRSTSGTMDTDCVTQNAPTNTYSELGAPAAGITWYFAFRSRLPNLGSWGLDGAGVERTGSCLP